jgi:L-lactate utilization protein LutC
VSSREEMLARIRAATADITTLPDVPRRYQPAGRGPGSADEALVTLFEERASDYRATVRRCAAAEVAQVIADAVAVRGAGRIGVPDGFPASWWALLPRPVFDDPPLDVAALDALDGVVTTCAVAIAETGTIVLDAGPGQGSRAFSLVPDYHLAVVRTGQVVAAVPDAVAALDPARPLTWISGPSATSDIELSRVEGVHGPRTLDIVIVAELGATGWSARRPSASRPGPLAAQPPHRALASHFRGGYGFRGGSWQPELPQHSMKALSTAQMVRW